DRRFATRSVSNTRNHIPCQSRKPHAFRPLQHGRRFVYQAYDLPGTGHKESATGRGARDWFVDRFPLEPMQSEQLRRPHCWLLYPNQPLLFRPAIHPLFTPSLAWQGPKRWAAAVRPSVAFGAAASYDGSAVQDHPDPLQKPIMLPNQLPLTSLSKPR